MESVAPALRATLFRTVHVINGLGPGGAERSLAELLPELAQHGFAPHVVTFGRWNEGVEDDIVESGIPVHHLEAGGWLRKAWHLRRLLKQLDPDVVHTTIFEADVIGRIASTGLRACVLTSIVNTSYEPVRLTDPLVRRSRLRIVQIIDGLSARFLGHQFHAITEAVRQSSVRRLRLDPQRITVIPRGRRRSRLGEPSVERRERTRREFKIAVDAVMVLHVGREEHQKNQTVLLRAIEPVLRQRSDLVLVMAGRSGNLTSKIDDLVENFSEQQVRRLGHTDRVPDLLAAADVFVFPSLFEGLGGAALEAMALEVPIVASDIPGLREFLSGVAIFADPSDANDLRRGIVQALDDPHARERAALGRRRFDSTFAHEKTTAAMTRLLRECAELSREDTRRTFGQRRRRRVPLAQPVRPPTR